MIPNTDLSGQQLGQFKLLRRLGAGGMAVVYEAHEMSLNRVVALKVIGGHLAADPSFVERFRREAQAAARLLHPGIVQIHSIGEDRGLHFFAMEIVRGKSVRELILAEGKLEIARALEITRQVADALAVAHAEKVVHRDIKPANILLTPEGLAKVADFGIAHMAAESKLTATGSFLGTPEYIAPELCMGLAVDERADIYSLGVTLYEMLIGSSPFSSETPAALLIQISQGDHRPLSEVAPDVPQRVSELVGQMMEVDRERRIQTAREVVSELDALGITAGGAVTAETVLLTPAAAPGERATRPGRGDDKTVIQNDPAAGSTGAGTASGPGKAETDAPAPSAPAQPLVAAPPPIVAAPPPARPAAEARTGSNRARGIALAFATVLALVLLAALANQFLAVGPTAATEAPGTPAGAQEPGEDDGLRAAGATTAPVEEPTSDRPVATGAESVTGNDESGPPASEPGGQGSSLAGVGDEASRPPDTPSLSPSAAGTTSSKVAVEGAAEAPETGPEPEPELLPEPVVVAAPGTVTVISDGEYQYVELIGAWVEQAFAARQFTIIDARSFAPENLPQQARHQVVMSARVLSTRTLEYFGESTTQFTVALSMKVVSLENGQLVSGPRAETVSYTHLNVEQNLRQAATGMARELARDLATKQ